jgi:hypothetical protein
MEENSHGKVMVSAATKRSSVLRCVQSSELLFIFINSILFELWHYITLLNRVAAALRLARSVLEPGPYAVLLFQCLETP